MGPKGYREAKSAQKVTRGGRKKGRFLGRRKREGNLVNNNKAERDLSQRRLGRPRTYDAKIKNAVTETRKKEEIDPLKESIC